MKALLEDAARTRGSRSESRRLLGYPWCQPLENNPLYRAAANIGFERRSPRPGEVLLVSVDDGQRDQGSIWAFGEGGSTPLLDDARAVLDRVQWDVLRDFAGWRVPTDIGPAAPFARWLAGSSSQPPDELTGASFGAAFLLSVVSVGLQREVPGDLVVLAMLDAQGRLGPVDGLETKLRMVSEWAPGVGRCIVATSDQERAETLSPALAIVGVETASDLVDEVFSEMPAIDAEAQAKRLFLVAMSPDSRLVSWERFCKEAAKTADAPGLSPTARWQAQVAGVIAGRHTCGPREPLPKMPKGALPLRRPLLERFQSHHVQHLADSGDVDDGLVDRMVSELPAVAECSLTQLELRGAVGRALSRRRNYELGEKLLGETVEAWFEIGRAAESGRPLSEWARVAGIRKDRRVLAQRIAPYALRLAIEFRATSKHVDAAFLALAMGRAWTQVGSVRDASPWWGDRSWQHAPSWIVGSRERWRARGKWHEGDRDGALALLSTILGEADMAALARLDACVLIGTDAGEAVAAFLETEGASETTWLLQDSANVNERALRLHQESPY